MFGQLTYISAVSVLDVLALTTHAITIKDLFINSDVYRIESIVSYWYHKTNTSIISK